MWYILICSLSGWFGRNEKGVSPTRDPFWMLHTRARRIFYFYSVNNEKWTANSSGHVWNVVFQMTGFISFHSNLIEQIDSRTHIVQVAHQWCQFNATVQRGVQKLRNWEIHRLKINRFGLYQISVSFLLAFEFQASTRSKQWFYIRCIFSCISSPLAASLNGRNLQTLRYHHNFWISQMWRHNILWFCDFMILCVMHAFIHFKWVCFSFHLFVSVFGV